MGSTNNDHLNINALDKSRKSILVIDDCYDLLELNKTILEMADHNVSVAASGKEALNLLAKSDKPDLILLDMNLGDMSGQEFLEFFEQYEPEKFTATPVVFFTGMDDVELGPAVGIMYKSMGVAEFLKNVNRYLNKTNKLLDGHSPVPREDAL